MTPEERTAILAGASFQEVADAASRMVATFRKFGEGLARAAKGLERYNAEGRLNACVRAAQLRTARRLGQVPRDRAHGHLFRSACPSCGAVV